LEASRNPLFRLPILVVASLVVVVLGPAVLDRGSSAEDAPPPPRETQVCLDCHDDRAAALALSPHHVEVELAEGMEALVTCTDCHSGDARHYEEDPEEFPMTRPDAVGAVMEAELCSSCHQNSHQQNMREGNVHFDSDVSCSSCHRIHGAKEPGLLQSPEVAMCLSCHPGVEGQFAQSYRHPVPEGIMKCSECHLIHDETATELSWNGANAACVRCHMEFEGPFPYEHEATLDFATEEGGCLNCHAPHGSHEPRMLTQPYQPPHFQLCTQCHMVPPLHNQNSQHGSMWAGIACNECHADIHGSYTNRNLLSESLEVQGCLTAGCHK
jgi:DmsE family decaheme c-type cytochrome